MGKKEAGSKSIKGIVIASVSAAVIAASAAVVVLNLPKEAAPQEEVQSSSDGRGIVLSKDNVDEVLSNLNAEKVEQGFFETCMTNNWTFTDGMSGTDVYIKNEVTNTNTIYFDLFVDEGNKLVYSSPYLEIGAEMPQFQLIEIPEQGDYPGTIVYHLVDENNEEVSDVSIAVTLHIK